MALRNLLKLWSILCFLSTLTFSSLPIQADDFGEIIPLGRERLTGLALKPDGTEVAVSGLDALWLYDLDLIEVTSIPTTDGFVSSLAWSPDSLKLAMVVVTSDNGGYEVVEVWDAQTWVRTAEYKLPRSIEQTFIAWHPNDSQLIALSGADTITLWNFVEDRVVQTFSYPGIYWLDLAWNTNGDFIAAVGLNYTLSIWNATTGEHLASFPHAEPLFSLVWSPDSTLIAVGTLDGRIFVRNIFDGNIVKQQQAHYGFVGRLFWDNSTLISANFGGEILEWDPSHWQSKPILQNFSYPPSLFGLDINRRHDLAVTLESNGSIKTWNFSTGINISNNYLHSNTIYEFSWSHDSSKLASGGLGNLVKIWDGETASLEQILHTGDPGIHAIAWSLDDRFLAAAGNKLYIWDSTNEYTSITFGERFIGINAIEWSPDSRLIASAAYTEVKIWDTATGEEIYSYPMDETDFMSLTWSPDGSLLAATTRAAVTARTRTTLIIWDTATWQVKAEFITPDEIFGLKWDATGTHIVGIGNPFKRMIYIWDTATLSEAKHVTLPHEDEVLLDLIWSASDEVTAVDSSKIIIWDIATSQIKHQVELPQSDVRIATLDLTGRFVAMSCENVMGCIARNP